MAREKGETELVVFGRRSVLEALASDAVDVLEVAFEKRAVRGFQPELEAAAAARCVPARRVDRRDLDALTRAPQHDQGVAARVRLSRVGLVETYLGELKGPGASRGGQLLAVDGLTNSQNLGMLVRSAVAAGIDGMLWPLVGSPWINGLVVKASAGSVLRAPILRCESLVYALALLQGRGFELIGLDGRAEDSLFDVVPPARAVWVIGGETQGIGEAVAGLLDRRVRIPMSGGVESLNAAVAGALVCFHATGARAGGGREAPT